MSLQAQAGKIYYPDGVEDSSQYRPKLLPHRIHNDIKTRCCSCHPSAGKIKLLEQPDAVRPRGHLQCKDQNCGTRYLIQWKLHNRSTIRQSTRFNSLVDYTPSRWSKILLLPTQLSQRRMNSSHEKKNRRSRQGKKLLSRHNFDSGTVNS